MRQRTVMCNICQEYHNCWYDKEVQTYYVTDNGRHPRLEPENKNYVEQGIVGWIYKPTKRRFWHGKVLFPEGHEHLSRLFAGFSLTSSIHTILDLRGMLPPVNNLNGLFEVINRGPKESEGIEQ